MEINNEGREEGGRYLLGRAVELCLERDSETNTHTLLSYLLRKLFGAFGPLISGLCRVYIALPFYK